MSDIQKLEENVRHWSKEADLISKKINSLNDELREVNRKREERQRELTRAIEEENRRASKKAA